MIWCLIRDHDPRHLDELQNALMKNSAPVSIRLASLVATSIVVSTTTAFAGLRTSANYNIATDAADAGIARTTSAAYTIDSSIGDLTGISAAAAPAQTVKHGYVGQLYDITALTLTAASPTVNETATDQLAAWQALNDATFLAVPASGVAWSVQSGPLTSISTTGLATAGTVYQNTAASAQGIYLGQTGTLGLTVIETLPDNYRTYAADGLSDAWQVQYFGVGNPNAAPGIDFNHNGITNLLEFAFGTNPLTSTAAGLLYNGTLAGSGTITATGQPITLFESIATGVDFRALFVRRDDYTTYGLTYTVQFSPDLTVWTPSLAVPTVLADDGTHQVVSVPFPGFLNGKKARFFRVQVSTPP
jgi:hypothetical protein